MLKPLLISLLIPLTSCTADLVETLQSGPTSEATKAVNEKLLLDTVDTENLLELGFTPLIGNNLDTWKIHNDRPSLTFTLQEGVISGKAENHKGNSFLYTNETYKNYLLYFEFKFDHLKGNSGLLYHSKVSEKGHFTGLQYEMDPGDQTFLGMKRQWTGLIYAERLGGWHYPHRDGNISGLEKSTPEFMKQLSTSGHDALNEEGWNAAFVRIRGTEIQSWLNGTLRTDFDFGDLKFPQDGGHIGLQIHSGKACAVSWRNIYLLPIK